jgi:hypothetical protein
MLIVLSLLAVYGGWLAVKAAIASLENLPRTNEDWIHY